MNGNWTAALILCLGAGFGYARAIPVAKADCAAPAPDERALTLLSIDGPDDSQDNLWSSDATLARDPWTYVIEAGGDRLVLEEAS